jgi:hypothetical protein
MRVRSLLKFASSAVVLVALAASSGCLKSDETITVYPDGSGKIQMKTTLLGMMAQMVKAGGPGAMGGMGGPGGGGRGGRNGPADPFDLIKKNAGSKVYWTNLKAEDGASGEYTLSGTGYFEDVNQLNGRERQISFKKDEKGEGYVFEMKGQLPDDLTQGMGGGMGKDDGGKQSPEQEQMQKQMMEMMKGMLAGFDMKVKVIMPGAVTAAEGLKAADKGSREAVFALGEKDVQAIMEKKQEPPKEMRVTSGAPDQAALDKEMAAFKQELADAKAAQEAAKSAAKPAEKAPEGGDKKPADGGEKKGDKKQDF